MTKDRFLYNLKLLALIYLLYLAVRNLLFVFSVSNYIPFDEDFNHYFAGSYILKNGFSLYETKFKDLNLTSFIFSNDIPRVTNPPLLQLILLPLSFFTPASAWIIFTVLNILCTVFSVLIFLNLFESKFANFSKIIIISSLLASNFFYQLLRFSQVQGFILFLVILGFYGLKNKKYNLTAFTWALSFALKFYTWPLIAYLFFKKEYRNSALLSFVYILAFLALPVLFIDIKIYNSFLSKAFPVLSNWSAFLIKEGYLYKTLYNLRVDMLFGNQIVLFCSLVYLLSNLIVSYLLSKLDINVFQAFGILVLLSFCLAPTTWPHYYIALVIPGAIVFNKFNRSLLVSFILIFFSFLFSTSNGVSLPERANSLLLPKLVNIFHIIDFYQNTPIVINIFMGILAYLILFKKAS